MKQAAWLRNRLNLHMDEAAQRFCRSMCRLAGPRFEVGDGGAAGNDSAPTPGACIVRRRIPMRERHRGSDFSRDVLDVSLAVAKRISAQVVCTVSVIAVSQSADCSNRKNYGAERCLENRQATAMSKPRSRAMRLQEDVDGNVACAEPSPEPGGGNTVQGACPKVNPLMPIPRRLSGPVIGPTTVAIPEAGSILARSLQSAIVVPPGAGGK